MTDPYAFQPMPTGAPVYHPHGESNAYQQPVPSYVEPAAPVYQQPYGSVGYQYPGAVGTDGYAITSLVLSLLGISLLGVIFGHLSHKRIEQTGAGGRGMATAGLVIGYLGMLAGVAVFALTFAAGLGTAGY